jgi:hypothetical protein
MKKKMHPEELSAIDDPNKMVCEVLEVKKSAVVRQCLVQARKPAISPIIQGIDPNKVIELIPTIILETDPDDDEIVERTFLLVPFGVTVESESSLEYRGSFVYPQGAVFTLFEEV